jgi:short-subunit dehydrogenase
MSQSLLQVKQQFGEIDILINNAGAVVAAPLAAMETEDYQKLMDIHFFAVQGACQMIIPYFRNRREGMIVNICSIGGKVPVPHLSPYGASKYALAGYSQGAHVELRKDGVHVLTVYPGLMRTGSPVQGLFKGDHDKEFAWFAAADLIPGLSISARSAASKIVEAIQEKRSEVVISFPARLATFGFSFFPETFLAVMGLINRLLPGNSSRQVYSGDRSRQWLDEKMKPLARFLDSLQHQYNQKENTEWGYKA